MKSEEFSNQFDVLYNNITSNQAPGLSEYEKSVFLTKGQSEVVKNCFTANSKGNNLGQGYDDSAKRQADFSCLMKTARCPKQPVNAYAFTYNNTLPATTIISNSEVYATYNDSIISPDGEYTAPLTTYDIIASSVDVDNDTFAAVSTMGITIVIHGLLSKIDYTEQGLMHNSITLTKVRVAQDTIDPRSGVYTFPDDVFIVINEALYTTDQKTLQVIPLRYDEYARLMSKPFKRPLKNQAWRLNNSGINGSGRYVEIITNKGDENFTYTIRYVRRPKPIILSDLDGLTIEGYGSTQECELDVILHEDILQRAVELAKIAWTSTGQDNAQLVMTAGQRSE